MANKTKDQHNSDELAIFEAGYVKTLNGINCVSCGSELKDTYPGLIAILVPPQTPVICDGCGYTGYRIHNK